MVTSLKGGALLALLLATLATPALAEPIDTPARCEPTTEQAPICALRPTLLIVADTYEKQALQYASEAERYRTWASAEEYSSSAYGKRYTAKSFARHAAELSQAAAQSRTLATKYRHLAESPEARASGC